MKQEEIIVKNPASPDIRLEKGLAIIVDHQRLTEREGLVDAERVCRKLKELNYSGPVIIEEYFNSNIAESVGYLRKVIDRT